MQKLLVAAMLAVSVFAVPTLPASAAPLLSDAEANCLIFPVLKKECWERGAEIARATSSTVVASADTTAEAVREIDVPFRWWNCKAAPAGSGHLLDC